MRLPASRATASTRQLQKYNIYIRPCATACRHAQLPRTPHTTHIASFPAIPLTPPAARATRAAHTMAAEHVSSLASDPDRFDPYDPAGAYMPAPAPAPTCYFSLPFSTERRFSIDTPTTSPLTVSTTIYSHPSNPLLAWRTVNYEPSMSSPSEASSLLQLQTSAAHRPAARPLQSGYSDLKRPSVSSLTSNSNSTSSSSSSSSNSMSSGPSTICCCRCRRESSAGVQFGTNLYYCRHCASMTGYSAG